MTDPNYNPNANYNAGVTPASQIPPEDLASFQKANPGLTFNSEDLAHYNAAGPIDVSKIGTVPAFNLPPTPTPTAYDIGSLPTVSSLLNPAPTPLNTQQTDLQGKLLADTKTLGTKTAAQSTAETAAGLPGFNAQLTDINGQLQT